jgi:hypothetical protein
MKTNYRIKILWLVTGFALICILALKLAAQDTNIDWGTASDDQVILQAVELTTPTPSNEVPAFATFYSAQHSPISSSPWPPLPGNMNDFDAWNLGSNIWVLDDLGFDYDPVSASSSHSMMAMEAGGISPPGSGGTNIYSPAGSSFSFDPGTNLWIAQEAVAGGSFTGILSNTIPGVEYQLLSMDSLNGTQWVWQGEPLLATTNSVPWSLPFSPTNNFFLNALSLQSDSGSGIPSWWLLKYYGQDSNVNIEALAPADDGWTIYQQYAMGDSPYTFVTPPPPNGLNVVYNPNTGNAAITWTASPLATGYTIQRENDLEDYGNGTWGGQVNFTVSGGNTTNFVDTTVPPEAGYDLAYSGPTRLMSYSIQAQYSGGQNSAWSPSVWVNSWQEFMQASIVEGSGGQDYLAVNDLPPNTVGLQLSRIDSSVYTPWAGEGNDTFTNDPTYDLSFQIPVTNSTSGLYAFTNVYAPMDDYGYDNYEWYVQAINANGSYGAAVAVDSGFIPNPAGGTTNNWATAPFYDGRAQLKQNLIFLLRDPCGNEPFAYDIEDQYGRAEGNLTQEPAGYAVAGFYDTLSTWNGYTMSPGTNDIDVYRPFYENYLYANFIFNSGDIDDNGDITSRVSESLNGDPDNGANYLLLTNAPPSLFQQPTTAGVTISPQINSAETLFSAPYQPTGDDYSNGVYYDMAPLGFTYTYDPDTYTADFTMSASAANYFGIPIQSAEAYYYDPNSFNLETQDVSPGGSYSGFPGPIFPQTAQPELQTVGYDFWNPATDSLPGNGNFSPTNASRSFTIMSAGDTINVAGYAKMSVQNGYSGVYGYLGQYFDQAYEIDTNGNVTTNSAGVLSPYGQFFDTQPGPVALVTMPDVDTGERGTDTVYAIKIQLDCNHDGIMDLSSTGPDNTSIFEPYLFWCNNNFDRWGNDSDGLATLPLGIYYSETEQDDQENGACPYTPNTPTPDCNYLGISGIREIPCTRDLEDFARLWVCGVTSNLLASLPPEATVTLSMNALPSNLIEFWDVTNIFGSTYPGVPSIDLFAAADPDGGIGYQTNEAIASDEIGGGYVGRLGPGESIQLNVGQLGQTGNWLGDHYIWCGVSNGIGQLTLTISDGTNILGQTSAYIEIVDIKQMYERWTVGDDPNAAPTNVPSLATEGLPADVSAFQYTQPQEATPYILFVHGYNMTDSAKDFFAQTAYKRLYWQGYQGRFGAFQWPTTVANFNGPNFDQSEYESWRSGAGLLNLLTNLNNEYRGQVYVIAHSHGNVAIGEALRLGAQQGLGQIVNTYIAAQAAVDSHTYDPATPERPVSFGTPDRYGQYYTDGATNYFNGPKAAGTYVNFFNTNDWTLAQNVWQADQNQKPDTWQGYNYVPANDTWYQVVGAFDVPLSFPTNTYQIFSYCDQGHAYSLGAQPNVGGQFSTNEQISLPSVWPPDLSGHNYSDHIWHSSEFRSDYPQRWLFWNTVLTRMKLNSNP